MAIPDFLFDVVNGPTLTLLSGSVSSSMYMTDHGTIGFGAPGSPSVDSSSFSVLAGTSSYFTGSTAIIGTLTSSFVKADVISASGIYTNAFNATATTMSVGYLTVTQVINGTAKSASYVPASGVDVFSTIRPGTGVGGLIFTEHFVAATTALMGNLSITTSGTSAAGTLVSGSSGHPGVFQFATGTTETGRAAIGCLANSILFGEGTYSVETSLYIPVLSTSAQRFTIYFGFGDNFAAGDQVDGVYFQYIDSASPNWQIKTSNASTRTTTISSSVVTVGWTKLRVDVIGTATANFFVNDVLIGSISTNIPTGRGRETSVVQKLEKSVGTTRSIMLSDYIKLAYD